MNASLESVLRMRTQIITAALDAYDPQLLIVDKVALGLGAELEPALRMLRARGNNRCVLGLREILDAPDIAVREWQAARTSQSIDRYYDEVWVYGDRGVYDPVVEYHLPDAVAGKIVYTGYLGNGRGLGTTTLIRDRPSLAPPAQPYSLCLVGGGQDGLELAETFVRAQLPAGQVGVVLTGPFMRRSARQRLRQLVDDKPDKTLVEFVPDPGDFIDRAASVVSMAGYNSVCELLTSGARTLLVPRAKPRTEQLLRARRMSELGLVDMVGPADLSSRILGDWLGTADQTKPRRYPIDLDGLSRIPRLAAALLERNQSTATEGGSHAA